MDTLRDESCPVCGETDAWDGDACKVCGFVAPPDKFQDPDVDMHKRLDLRNNGGDLDGGDVNGLNADINDRDGDGLDDNTGEPIEQGAGFGDQQPMLTCPSCGYEVEGGEPQSVSTEDPVLGDASSEAAGPAAGDLCPNCGQAPLISPAELGEMGATEDPGADPALDPEADPDGVVRGPADEDPDMEDSEAEPDPEMEDRGSPFEQDGGDDQERDEDDAEEPDRESDGVRDVDPDDAEEPVRKKAPPGKK